MKKTVREEDFYFVEILESQSLRAAVSLVDTLLEVMKLIVSVGVALY